MTTAMAEPASRLQVMSALREVIAALDRRVPQGWRADAGAIGRDADRMRQAAVARLATLEREVHRAAETLGRGELAAPAND